MVKVDSSNFCSRFGDLKLQLPRPETRMGCRQADSSRLFLGSNPDRTGTAHERKRIVADYLRRSLDLERNGIVRKGADLVEFVRHSHDHARRIGSIADQTGVISRDREFRVNASPGHLFLNDLLALNVALQAKIAP